MSGSVSWRSHKTADQYRDHDYADFAQEFLQRNPDYRRDHTETKDQIVLDPAASPAEEEGLAGRWGLSFPTAPDADPRACPALWSPQVAPDVVVVDTADIAAIPLPPGFEPLADHSERNEHHLVAAKGAARLRLCLRTAPPRYPDCLVILRDQYAAVRLAAAARFERVTHGLRLGTDRTASPSAYRQSRLVQLLSIYDALDAGSDQRDIAFGLVFSRHRPLVGAAWKGSGERRHTLRLIAEARRLVNGGYRKLLRHN
jgi:hypothetical protein